MNNNNSPCLQLSKSGQGRVLGRVRSEGKDAACVEIVNVGDLQAPEGPFAPRAGVDQNQREALQSPPLLLLLLLVLSIMLLFAL